MGVTSLGPSIVSKVDGTVLIGAHTVAESIPVTMATDQPAIPVTPVGPITPVGAGTATNKSFTTTGAAVTQFTANANRLGWLINNPATGALNANADPIYVRLGATAAVDGTSFEVPAGSSFPPGGFPLYTGIISVIGATGIKCPAVELSA